MINFILYDFHLNLEKIKVINGKDLTAEKMKYARKRRDIKIQYS